MQPKLKALKLPIQKSVTPFEYGTMTTPFEGLFFGKRAKLNEKFEFLLNNPKRDLPI